MRDRHKIGRKALVIDTDQGALVMPIPDPSMEKGSLKMLFKGRTSKDIMNEIRREKSNYESKRRRGK